MTNEFFTSNCILILTTSGSMMSREEVLQDPLRFIESTNILKLGDFKFPKDTVEDEVIHQYDGLNFDFNQMSPELVTQFVDAIIDDQYYIFVNNIAVTRNSLPDLTHCEVGQAIAMEIQRQARRFLQYTNCNLFIRRCVREVFSNDEIIAIFKEENMARHDYENKIQECEQFDGDYMSDDKSDQNHHEYSASELFFWTNAENDAMCILDKIDFYMTFKPKEPTDLEIRFIEKFPSRENRSSIEASVKTIHLCPIDKAAINFSNSWRLRMLMTVLHHDYFSYPDDIEQGEFLFNCIAHNPTYAKKAWPYIRRNRAILDHIGCTAISPGDVQTFLQFGGTFERLRHVCNWQQIEWLNLGETTVIPDIPCLIPNVLDLIREY